MFGEVKPILIDTDVIINHLRGQVQETAFLKRIMIEEEFQGLYSAVTEVELFAAEKVNEAQVNDIKSILDNLKRIELTSAIAQMAGNFLGRFRKSHSLEMPDAIIGASVLICNASLATVNTRHYSFIPGLLLTSPAAFFPG
ncbi:MAG: type II toxin-antitoxin system VapC family toxin [Peptococcaceae bacterium]|nr:MAG: type II toxin-antitoxin system VapC family toxin [Peptococcaceae bacterium]